MDKAAPDIAEAAPDIDKAAPPSSQGPGGAVRPGLLDFRPGPWLEGNADVADGAAALALASAKVYTFLSIDYPGAAQSEIWDFNHGAAVGMFVFDPGADGAIGTGDANPGAADANPIGTGDANPGDAGGGTSLSLPPSRKTAFTFQGDFVCRILTVPNATESIATGIDTDGRIVGWYVGLDGVRRGFVKDGNTFNEFGSASQVLGVSDNGRIVGSIVDTSGREHGFVGAASASVVVLVDFPGAHGTIATGINDAGHIVGSWQDASGNFHGFLRSDIPFDFPLAAETRVAGINDAGEIVGSYRDAAGTVHGFFISADGILGTVDVPGAKGTVLTRIKNGGLVTGFCIDALNGRHGFLGT